MRLALTPRGGRLLGAAAAPDRLFGGRADPARPDRGPGGAADLDPGRRRSGRSATGRPPSALAAPADGAVLAELRSLLPPLRRGGPGGRHLAQPQALRRARGPGDRARLGDHRPARRPPAAASRSARRSCRASTLTAVGFDNVTISRGGARRADLPRPVRSRRRSPAAPRRPRRRSPPPAAAAGRRAAPPAPAAPARRSASQPRIAGGRVNGIIVSPGGDGGQAFRAAGFQPGDVIVSVNGQRVTSLEQARAAIGRRGGEVNVMVDRGGRAVPAAGEAESVKRL